VRHPILVVDDDPELRQTLSEVLADSGYQVVVAANGAEALDRLHEGLVPALILLDLMMPVLDGWEFCARQRADPSIASIPVVLMSASVNLPSDQRRGRFISKPFELDTLLDAVRVHAGDAA
jgi:CheY-like chemotaxis protein